ncbi:MAG TPA: flavin reductase family protein [Burkholderiales bacterium]|nr:flavin reductase family protein [Burkholderiales bacterium]
MESRSIDTDGHAADPEAASLSGKAAAAAAVAIDTQKLRDALGCFATGITIVTARAPDGQVAGVTANSFCSVSLEPPLVLWCLSKSAPSQSIFVKAGHFAIHVLAEDQAHLSARFCKPSKNKFAGLAMAEGLGRAPLLDGVVALFECRSEHRYEGGDHYIIVGRVERYHHADRPPLLFHTGGYRGLGRP